MLCTLVGPMTTRTRSTLILVGGFTVYWLVMLPLDRNTDRAQQSALAVTTWMFLAVALWVSPRHERVQVVTMVGVATAFEIVGSIIWGLYTYRLENLPLYVPPGHGLFYLSALRVAQLPFVERHARHITRAVLAGATVLMVGGLTLRATPDVLGAVSWVALVPFLAFGRFPVLFAVSFSMTMALEFYGTALGSWAWAPVVPLLGLPAANPPACIGAGYCVMDRIARHVAPVAERAMSAMGEWWSARRAPLPETAAARPPPV